MSMHRKLLSADIKSTTISDSHQNANLKGAKICFFVLMSMVIITAIFVVILPIPDDIKVTLAITTFAGLAAIIGGLSIFCVNQTTLSIIPISLSFSAGVMVYLSLMNLIPESIHEFEHAIEDEGTSHLFCTLTVVLAMIFTMAMEYMFHKSGIHSHHTGDECVAVELNEATRRDPDHSHATEENVSELSRVSYSMAIGLILHHFPEGIATFVSLYHDLHFGALIAFALAVHDIPTGMSVAVPIYLSTGSKFIPLFLCFLAGVTYPVAGFVAWALIETTSDEFMETLNGILFGAAGGILLYIAFVELLPAALFAAQEYNKPNCTKYTNLVTWCHILFFVGFFIMDTSNIVLKYTGAGHSH